MNCISGREWHRHYADAFHSIFHNVDPFDQPLSDGARGRMLLSPVNYTLSQEQFEAACAAARAVGDQHVCVSVTEEFECGSGLTATHWLFEFWEYAEYSGEASFGVLENAVYSPSGKWGILFSHEQHAIVGGTLEFVATFTQNYPDVSNSVPDFLRYWGDVHLRHGTPVGWVPRLLSHIYGGEEARRLMARTEAEWREET